MSFKSRNIHHFNTEIFQFTPLVLFGLNFSQYSWFSLGMAFYIDLCFDSNYDWQSRRSLGFESKLNAWEKSVPWISELEIRVPWVSFLLSPLELTSVGVRCSRNWKTQIWKSDFSSSLGFVFSRRFSSPLEIRWALLTRNLGTLKLNSIHFVGEIGRKYF